MRPTSWWRRICTLAVLGAWSSLQVATVGSRGAQRDTTSEDWQATALTQPVRQLFTTEGGVLFASTDQQLLRSDDAGLTWSPIALPDQSRVAAVDPTDPNILYAVGAEGLYRTADGAASWQVSLRYAPDVGSELGQLGVSPADHNRLYLELTQRPGVTATSRLLRSSDAGQSWQRLQSSQASLCAWSVLLLQPHPMDPDRLFRATACLAGRTFGASLEQSTDAGAAWGTLFNPDPYGTPALGYPTRLVGGHAGALGRYYLATNRDARLGGSALVRSDDDGATWSEVLTFHGGGTPGYRQPDDPPDAPNTRLGGLVADAADPDRVYIGLLVYDQYPPRQPIGGGAMVSTDGGTSWGTLGRQDLGGIVALVLSPDDRHLYAATGQGLYRLDLPEPDAAFDLM